MPTTNLPARLRRIMRAMHWSQAELAAAAGASKQTVSRWLKDGQIRIDPAFAYRLQDATGFSARWILLAEGPVYVVDVGINSLPRKLRDEYARHLAAVAMILGDAAA